MEGIEQLCSLGVWHLTHELLIQAQVYHERLGIEGRRETLIWCIDRRKEGLNVTVFALPYMMEPIANGLLVKISVAPQVFVEWQPYNLVILRQCLA